MTLLILVVDDEPDVEELFRQQFRREIRAERFTIEFAQSAAAALVRIAAAEGASLILILSDINMPEMSGLELLPKARAMRAGRGSGVLDDGGADNTGTASAFFCSNVSGVGDLGRDWNGVGKREPDSRSRGIAGVLYTLYNLG